MEEIRRVTSDELSEIQSMNSEFTKAKVALGDLELQKYALLKKIDELKSEFRKIETVLMDKYGNDSVINLQTGIITRKSQVNIKPLYTKDEPN